MNIIYEPRDYFTIMRVSSWDDIFFLFFTCI